MRSKCWCYNMFEQSLHQGFSRGSCSKRSRGSQQYQRHTLPLEIWKGQILEECFFLLLKYEALFIPLLVFSIEEAKYQEECLHMPPQKSRTPLQIICTRIYLFEKCCPICNNIICEETVRVPGNITACLNDTWSNTELCWPEAEYFGNYIFGCIQPC